MRYLPHGNAFGAQAGGHTLNIAMSYMDATEVNTAGCVGCHTSDEAIQKMEELQAEVGVLLAELKTELDATGITAEGSDNSFLELIQRSCRCLFKLQSSC